MSAPLEFLDPGGGRCAVGDNRCQLLRLRQAFQLFRFVVNQASVFHGRLTVRSRGWLLHPIVVRRGAKSTTDLSILGSSGECVYWRRVLNLYYLDDFGDLSLGAPDPARGGVPVGSGDKSPVVTAR